MICRSFAGYIKARCHMATSMLFGRCLVGVFFSALLSGCASTTTTLTPSPQAPVCDSTATALILWAPQWRPDQKDVAQRGEAAATGLASFLAGSGCFARSELRRVPDISKTLVDAQAAAAVGQFTQVVVVGVRELGPVVKLLSSAAMVEGGTEVVLQVTSRSVSVATNRASSLSTGAMAVPEWSRVWRAFLPTCRPPWPPACSQARLRNDT
jgi:hypothetical protein